MGMTPEDAFAQALAAARNFTKKTIAGTGAIQGKPGKDGTDGKSAYQIALDNGFAGTEEEWLASLKGEKGEPGESSSYNDTELREDIADIWKVQGEVGSKNLLAYPYDNTSRTTTGITWRDNGDGSWTVNGTSTDYSYVDLKARLNSVTPKFIPNNNYYTCSIKNGNVNGVKMVVRVQDATQGTILNETNISTTPKQVSFTNEVIENINNGTYIVVVRLYVDANKTIDNVTVYPMIRYASDPDDTWQPPTPTNRQLAEQISAIKNELAPLIGEYLPPFSGSSLRIRTVEAGGTSATFYAGAFINKYGVATTSLDLDISAETRSGNVVAYNNVSIDPNNGIVTITFDELTEQTTFICKCSVIK